MQKKTILIPLVLEKTYSTASATEVFYVLDTPKFTNLGPMIESLRTHINLHEANGLINVRVVGRKSFDGTEWDTTPFQIQAPLTSANVGYNVGSSHNNAADYGLYLRAEIGVVLTSGTTLSSAVLSGQLEVTLKS